jgi:hypothetical protein
MATRTMVALAVLPLTSAACSTTSISGDVANDTTEVATEPDVVEAVADPGDTAEPAPDIHHDPDLEPDAEEGGVVGDACYSRTQCTGVPSENRVCLTTVEGFLHFPGG